VTARARKAAPVCCDCHGRAESICGGCGRPICGSEVCLAEHEHAAALDPHKAAPRYRGNLTEMIKNERAPKAAPNPHDQVARELAAHRRGIDRRKIREMAVRYTAKYRGERQFTLSPGDLIRFGVLVAAEVRLKAREAQAQARLEERQARQLVAGLEMRRK
jgi:hypothetical protein